MELLQQILTYVLILIIGLGGGVGVIGLYVIIQLTKIKDESFPYTDMEDDEL